MSDPENLLLLDGRPARDVILRGLAPQIERLQRAGETPRLDIISTGVESPAGSFAASLVRFASRHGIEVRLHTLADDVTEEDYMRLLGELNGDAGVHAILPTTPLPWRVRREAVSLAIDPAKDVDGLHPMNLGLLFLGQAAFVPSTALGVMRLLDHYQLPIAGKRAVILGRSLTVGRPLGQLLQARNATVTLCHRGTRDLAAVAREGEILISAMGQPRMVGRGFLLPGAVVVDVGTTLVEGRLLGDVRFEEAKEVVQAITPVPYGIGPVTVASLLDNVMQAAHGLMRIPTSRGETRPTQEGGEP